MATAIERLCLLFHAATLSPSMASLALAVLECKPNAAGKRIVIISANSDAIGQVILPVGPIPLRGIICETGATCGPRNQVASTTIPCCGSNKHLLGSLLLAARHRFCYPCTEHECFSVQYTCRSYTDLCVSAAQRIIHSASFAGKVWNVIPRSVLVGQLCAHRWLAALV